MPTAACWCWASTPVGQPTGLSAPALALDQAVAAALVAEPPLVLPLPELVMLDGRELCVVHVPPGLSQVYSIKGQYLVRAGRENRAMSTAELRTLLIARGEGHFESTVAPAASQAELDEAAVASYLERLPGLSAESLAAALLTRGCLKATPQGDFVPTYAGILLFGRNPQQYLPSAEIIAVRYAGTTMSDEFVREDIRGSLGEQILPRGGLSGGQHASRHAHSRLHARGGQPSTPWPWHARPWSTPWATATMGCAATVSAC